MGWNKTGFEVLSQTIPWFREVLEQWDICTLQALRDFQPEIQDTLWGSSSAFREAVESVFSPPSTSCHPSCHQQDIPQLQARQHGLALLPGGILSRVSLLFVQAQWQCQCQWQCQARGGRALQAGPCQGKGKSGCFASEPAGTSPSSRGEISISCLRHSGFGACWWHRGVPGTALPLPCPGSAGSAVLGRCWHC